jgi:hypothetical protein
MINKILTFFGFKKDKRELNTKLFVRMQLLESLVDMLAKELSEHVHCDGSQCDPWPSLTKEEKESGCEWKDSDFKPKDEFSEDFRSFMSGWKESEGSGLAACNHVGCDYDSCLEGSFSWGGSYENLDDKENQKKELAELVKFTEDTLFQTQEQLIEEAFRKGQEHRSLGSPPTPEMVAFLNKYIDDLKEDVKEGDSKANEVKEYFTGFDYNSRLNADGGLVVKEGEMIMELKDIDFSELREVMENKKKKVNKHTGGSFEDFFSEEIAKKVTKKKASKKKIVKKTKKKIAKKKKA